MRKSGVTVLGAILLSVLISGCGGGGGDDGGLSPAAPESPAPAPTAEGVYGGTLTGSIGNAFEALVLENGEFWALYGDDAGSIFQVYGFIQGKGTSNNGSFTASDVRDFGYFPPVSGTLTATYNSAAKTISGSARAEGMTVQFSGGPIPGSLYNYDTPASLSAVAGSWHVVSTAAESISINVTADGSVTTLGSGCTSTGSITPRPSGKNVFNISLRFGPAPCALPNATATGIAVVYPLSTGQTQLIAAVTDSSRTFGVGVFGIR